MSILLESLSQKPHSKNESVPDLTVTHYDDEMMSDEWLIRRLRNLKLLAFGLTIALVASWLYFYSYESSQVEKNNSRLSNLEKQLSALNTNKQQEKKPIKIENTNSTRITSNEPPDKPIAVVSAPLLKNTLNTETEGNQTILKDKSSSVVKQDYKPQRRAAIQMSDNLDTEKPKIEPAMKKAASKRTVSIDELSSESQQQFPNIVINSYVVAETAKDSFVILDGAFYKVNQVISPGLVLREISNEGIVVDFHSQRVKVPHK